MKQRLIIIFFLVLAGGLSLFLLKDFVSPYINFQDAKKSPGQVQIMGLPIQGKPGSRDTDGCFFILLTDYFDPAETALVRYCGNVPQNIEHSKQIVVIGGYDSKKGYFEAERLLYKCPSKYEKIEKNEAN